MRSMNRQFSPGAPQGAGVFYRPHEALSVHNGVLCKELAFQSCTESASLRAR